jgi:hypothetical protein
MDKHLRRTTIGSATQAAFIRLHSTNCKPNKAATYTQTFQSFAPGLLSCLKHGPSRLLCIFRRIEIIARGLVTRLASCITAQGWIHQLQPIGCLMSAGATMPTAVSWKDFTHGA